MSYTRCLAQAEGTEKYQGRMCRLMAGVAARSGAPWVQVTFQMLTVPTEKSH